TIPVTESDEFIKSGVENLIPIPSESEGILKDMCDVPSHDNSPPLDVSKDQFEDLSESNKEFSSINDDSFSIDNIDYVEASPSNSELVNSEVMEFVIPEVGGIDDDILLTIKDDILREKLLNVNLLIAKIEALNASPTPSFECKTKSSSTSLNSLLEETNTFDILYPSLKLSALMSKRSVVAVPLLLLIFLFQNMKFSMMIMLKRSVEPNSRDFTKDVVEDISPTKEPQVLNALPTHPTLQLNMKFQPSSESLFTYVVWIFLPFLVYLVAPYYLLSLRNEDAIFDPGICNSYFSRPVVSHRCGTVKKFNTHHSHLNECPMLINGKNNPPLDFIFAIRQLAYGMEPDAVDEFLQMSDRTSRQSLDHFCTSVMKILRREYLRKPTVTDVVKLYRHHQDTHRFPGMLGSLDCTNWEWLGCSYAHKAQYVRRDHGSNPFILLEAIVSQDLCIWHDFFGVARLNNDINVLHQSLLFNDLKSRRAPKIPFVANGITYP
nr:hypothetical protein [Tanacetum cinerariifolium]